MVRKKVVKKKVRRKAPVVKDHSKDKTSAKHIKLDMLKEHPDNPMNHDETRIMIGVKSLEKYGQTRTIVVWQDPNQKDGVRYVLAGNRMYQAAKRFGMTTILCSIKDDLTEAEALAYVIDDNVIGDQHVYDDGKMTNILGKITNTGMALDFTELTQTRISSLTSSKEAPDDFNDLDDDIDLNHRCPKCGFEWS